MNKLMEEIDEMHKRVDKCEILLREFEKESKILGQYIYTSKIRK